MVQRMSHNSLQHDTLFVFPHRKYGTVTKKIPISTILRLIRLQWACHIRRMIDPRIPEKKWKCVSVEEVTWGNPEVDGRMLFGGMP